MVPGAEGRGMKSGRSLGTGFFWSDENISELDGSGEAQHCGCVLNATLIWLLFSLCGFHCIFFNVKKSQGFSFQVYHLLT